MWCESPGSRGSHQGIFSLSLLSSSCGFKPRLSPALPVGNGAAAGSVLPQPGELGEEDSQ